MQEEITKEFKQRMKNTVKKKKENKQNIVCLHEKLVTIFF
jgi:hypothetical protein